MQARSVAALHLLAEFGDLLLSLAGHSSRQPMQMWRPPAPRSHWTHAALTSPGRGDNAPNPGAAAYEADCAGMLSRRGLCVWRRSAKVPVSSHLRHARISRKLYAWRDSLAERDQGVIIDKASADGSSI